MTPNDVIGAYVHDVTSRLPRAQRGEVGVELRGLLGEMLAERWPSAGQALAERWPSASQADTIAMLREFGAPDVVAARYRSPSFTIIAPEDTATFVRWALMGLTIQWAVGLAVLLRGEASIVQWWLSSMVGAFWWPGVMVMASLAAAWLRERGFFQRQRMSHWKPSAASNPEHLSRPLTWLTLVWTLMGAAFMGALPWLVPKLPAPLSSILAFDAAFISQRAWPAPLLWAFGAALEVAALRAGRWTLTLRRWEAAGMLAWIALLAWWMSAGPMFVAPATNDGARGGLALVVLIIAIDAVVKWRRVARARSARVCEAALRAGVEIDATSP